jgi:ferredoxin
LTILDGILGQEGNGPGMGGTPHLYGCVAASTDPVALDVVVAQALGYRRGEVVYVDQAGARGLGVSRPGQVRVVGDKGILQWGKLELPTSHWYFRVPGWVTAPFARITRVRPRLIASACVGCGACAEVCPKGIISYGHPPAFDLKDCVGCLCCAEICPQAAIEPKWSWMAQLIGIR